MNEMLDICLNISPQENVIVSTPIEKDCQSAPFNAADLFAEELIRNSEPVKLFAKENILKCNSKNWAWIKGVRLAEDCQSYNLELRLQSSKTTFALATTRKIHPTESPVLWFSQEILILLRVPHLSLSNIQGEKKYICHRCLFQCEMPNPLKVHLALECGSLKKEDLWRRLKPLDVKSSLPLPTSPLNFSVTPNTLPSMPLVVLPAAELMATRTSSISAFKPYQRPIPKIVYEKPAKVRVDGMTKIFSILPPPLPPPSPLPPLETPLTSPKGTEGDKRDGANRSLADIDEATILYKRAIEMETIASNLGKFKQGHICIYCGKVYSRKYGLKIHIRTHTGFKPLKCKYCLRPFGDPSNLNKHVRLHSEGDAPYKCEQCGKILVRKRDLDRHIKSRH